MTPAQILGAAIAARRQATFVERDGRRLQMSQQELADAAGCAKNHISDIERGKKWPSSALLARIATALGCDVRFELSDIGHRLVSAASRGDLQAVAAAVRSIPEVRQCWVQPEPPASVRVFAQAPAGALAHLHTLLSGTLPASWHVAIVGAERLGVVD